MGNRTQVPLLPNADKGHKVGHQKSSSIQVSS